jgi:arylsulfatase A-like enzyme
MPLSPLRAFRWVPLWLLATLLAGCGAENWLSGGESRSRSNLAAVQLFELEPVEGVSQLAAEDLLDSSLVEPAWVLGEPTPRDAWSRREQSELLALHPLEFALSPGPWTVPLSGSGSRRELREKTSASLVPDVGSIWLTSGYAVGRWADLERLPKSLGYPTPLRPFVSKFAAWEPDQVPSLQEMTLRGDTRRAVRLLAPSSLVYQAYVPEKGRLSLAYTGVGPAVEIVGDELRISRAHELRSELEILVELEGGAPTPVWSGSLDQVPEDEYTELHVDLARYAGQEVRLHFRLTCEGDAGGGTYMDLAEPVLWGAGHSESEAVSVVLIVLDTLRASRLGCYGWTRAETPHLDRFAEQGLRFTDVTSAANWTLPAHASLFTSTFSSQHGLVSNQRLAESIPTLAELLRDRGYRTAAFAEGGFLHPRHGFARGFESFSSEAREVERTLSHATSWIREQEGPFFAFVHTYKVHSPYDPEGPFRSRLVRDYEGALPEVVNLKDEDWGSVDWQDKRYVSDLYDAEIAELDAALGVMFEELSQVLDPERTLIIITSDHGEEFLEHGHVGHGTSAFQEQVAVPLLMQWGSRLQRGQAVEVPVHTVDVATTILAATNTAAPALYEGANLLAELAGVTRPVFSPMVPRWSDPSVRDSIAVVVREGSLKYLVYPTPPNSGVESEAALFDLALDPAEANNLLDEQSRAYWEELCARLLGAFPLVESVEGTAESQALKRELEALGYVDGQ